MGYLDEYYKLKKKREEQMQKSSKGSSTSTSTKTSTDSPYLNAYNQLKAEREAKISADLQKMSTMVKDDSDIGPVTVSSKDKKEETEKKKWFNSGLFDDGYQFGDVAKTILGTGSDLAEDALTVIIGMGEKIVDAGAFVAPYIAQGQFYQNGGAYQSPAVQKTQNEMYSQARKEAAVFIKNDLYNENEIAKRILSEVPGALQMSNINQAGGYATAQDWERNRQMQEESQNYLDNTMEKTSVLGDKSDALVQSAGQLAATVGLQAVGVPWWITTGATSFGAEAENALNQGATYEEAGLSATITAGAEILTEKISGGIKFGGKTLDEGLTRQLSRVITDKTIRTLSKVGMDVVGEGGEEVLSGYLSAIGQKLTYADEKEMSELFSSEDALDAFIGGAILGGVSSAGQAVNETVKGNDYASGLTNSEKAVVDKVYQDAIAEQEANGKKLSQSEKSKIYDKTLNDLEKGYIDTDTIESVIGGETYNTYKSTVESEDALQKEYDELYHMKNGEKSDAQRDRQEELKKQLDELKTTSKRTQLKEQLDNEVLGLVQGSKLSESYNEKSRRGQKFEADLTQYDSKQAEVVKKAVESGILNNTNRTHDFVDMIAKVSAEKGVSFDFMNNKKLKESGFAVEGKTVNGFVKDGNVTLNIDSAKALNTVVGHEITHVLEGTELYTELQNVAIEYAKTKGEYDTRLQALTKLYEGVEGANVEAELTADLVGDYLFTDADFINNLSTGHRNVFQKIYDEIKYLYKMATAGSKEARELEKVKKAFEKAYREGGKTDSEKVQFSLTNKNITEETEIPYTVDTSYHNVAVNDNAELTKLKNEVKGITKGTYENKATGYKADINGTTISKILNPTKAFNPWDSKYNYIENLNAAKHLAELFENAVYIDSKPPQKTKNVGKQIKEYHHFVAPIEMNNNDYRVLITAREKVNSNTLYVVKTEVLPNTKRDASVVGQEPTNLIGAPRTISIADLVNGVNIYDYDSQQNVAYSDKDIKFPLIDSDGKQLTQEQQEFFKDSKVRDENGNLMVVYHGSKDYGFTVFDTSKSDDGMSLFFTNDENMANSYVGDKEKLYKTYLNLKNPYIVDAKGHRWNQIRLGENTDAITGKVERFVDLAMRYDVEIDFALVGENLGSMSDSVEFMLQDELENLDEGETSLYSDAEKAELRQLAAEIDDAYESWDEEAHLDEDGEPTNMRQYLFEHKLSTAYTTRQIAKIAKDQGNDGVIINNVYDNGKFTSDTGIHGFGNVYIAFDSNQVKSVDNANPTSDPDIHKSLSETDIAPSPYGNYNVFGKDIALEQEIGPVREDLVQEVVQDSPRLAQDLVQDYAPLTEAEANERDDAQIDSKYFLDQMAPEPEAPIYNEDAEPESPFDERDFEDVGSQKVKAYMYENPEVKPFFQEEARIMLSELDNSVKGERVVNANMLYDTGGEFGVYGTKRLTSEAIAYLRDSKYNYTYEKIREGLNAIIEDHGAENNAISKRIEFLLDERLREGYTDTIFTGEKIPPNQEYLNLLTEKQITEYNDEAWDNFVRGLSQEDMQQYFSNKEDIAPPVETKNTAPIEDAPIREDLPLYEDNSGQQSMFDTEDAETKRVNDFLQKERAKVTEAYEQKKAELQGLIADQNTYRSNKALELYSELSHLQKGVKASEQLGYLLDYGYPWHEVKKALRNIWYHPGAMVDVESIPESVAREMLDKEYENESYALSELEAEYRRQLEEVEAKAEEMRTKEREITRSALHGDIIDNIKSVFNKSGFDLDNVLNKAKDLSTFATVDNTPQRVMEKALGYKQGQILNDLTVNKVAQNETEGTKWLDSFTNRKNGLLAQISKQYNIKPGSKKSAAAQMYAEGFYVDEDNNIIAYGNAELEKDFPKYSDRADIRGLAKDPRIRKIYDDTLAMINASRKRNAYPEIPRLDNYFLHFRAMEDTFSRLGLPFNPNDIRAKDLPTDLNGVTADLKPGQPYFASAMHRTGKRTSFDLLGGLERYLTSAKNQIYHIDDIQTLRALRNYIADTYGQAKGLEGLDALTEEEAQERIEEVYGSHLSTFAKFLNEEANVIAGKTTLIDRGLEGVIGRRGITFLDTINRQVGANMVGFNISSSLTNFLPVAQTFAKTNKADFLKAFAQTVSNKVGSVFGRNDGFAEQSPVMIRRKGADRFYRTPWQKVGDAGYVFMGAVDSISTELITRTKYNELVRKGMEPQKAHYETDKWVSRMMGDRSIGQQPQLYNSKMLGVFTKFQLEVRNQLDAQFYDTIQESKVSNEDIQNGLARNAKTAAKVASTFVQLAVVQHLFGKAFESVAGYNPAFDIIAAILKAVGYDDDEESEDTVLDNIEQGFLELLGDLPYTSTFTGGRIPIASALPIEQFITGKDDYGNEKSRLETIREAAPYYVLPAGYGQIKKTYQGLSMFDDDLPIAGSYTDSGNLRFPVEDTLQNRVQAGVFGQWASGNARDYFDNERNPLKEKQIEELVDLDLPIADYWKYREGLAEQETLEDKFDYIAGLDVSVEQKNIMINNVVDRKEKVDMSNYDDFSGYDEFDFYAKNTDKYNFLEENGVSYAEYISDEDMKKEYDNAYSWYKNNPEKVTVSKAITDNVIEYRRYTSELNDIRADKDADGDSITGSAKEKKVAYINGLDLDYGQKIILLRSYYDGKEDKETYNADIVEYLNGREDISYEEMVTILEELDFKVYPDGTVEW